MATCLVTGGAGFLGSHLCDELLARGNRVICVDNLETGSLANIAHIRDPDRFVHLGVDIIEPYFVEEPIDFVYHLASPASPIDYLRLPLHTLKVGSYGTHHTLGLAKAKRARFLIASTSEVYGDPLEHPQSESYWGHVNPIGPRGVYDEAKRYAEALTMAYHRQQGVDTAIMRIFNSILADEQVLYDDGTELRRETGRAGGGAAAAVRVRAPATLPRRLPQRAPAPRRPHCTPGAGIPARRLHGAGLRVRRATSRPPGVAPDRPSDRGSLLRGAHALRSLDPRHRRSLDLRRGARRGARARVPSRSSRSATAVAIAGASRCPSATAARVSMLDVWRHAEADQWDLDGRGRRPRRARVGQAPRAVRHARLPAPQQRAELAQRRVDEAHRMRQTQPCAAADPAAGAR